METFDLEQIKKEFAEADKRMEQAEKDLKALESFREEYKRIMENMRELTDLYFHRNWLEKKYFLEEAGQAEYGAASEDGIWNLHAEFHSQKINMLKLVSDDIYNDTFN